MSAIREAEEARMRAEVRLYVAIARAYRAVLHNRKMADANLRDAMRIAAALRNPGPVR